MAITISNAKEVRMSCNTKCHILGFISLISILQKVTYRRAKRTTGMSSTRRGPTASPNGCKKGTLAKIKYPKAPKTREQGKANFLKNENTFIIRTCFSEKKKILLGQPRLTSRGFFNSIYIKAIA